MANRKRLKDYTEEDLQKMSSQEREHIRKLKVLKATIKTILFFLIIIFIIITLFNCFKSIPTGFVGVKTQFGKVQNSMLNEGINFKIPYIEKIVLMDCRTQLCNYTMEASSKDLQKISNIEVSINYNVSKDSANLLYKEVGVEYKSIIIEPTIFEVIKSTIANYTAEELVTKRTEVSDMATDLLIAKLENKGITITAMNLTNLEFSKEFDAAIEQKQIIEQQAKAAELELEKAKIENETKIENAKAEAEVMRQQNSQITEQALKLKELEIQKEFIEKWNGNLPSTMLSDNIQGLFSLGK